MSAAHLKWRAFALCILVMTIIGFASCLIAIANPRYGWTSGWLGMWLYVRFERAIRRAP